jgi:histidine phosphotransferase ChpT
MSQDLQLAELMAARLCHDLVGPIGAVANGIELLGEGGAQWFRFAFGTANALPGSAMMAETRRLASGLFEEGRVTLDWPAPDEALEAATTRPGAKLALNLTLLGLESLPRGGTVRVRFAVNNGLSMSVIALGAGARIPDDIEVALRPGALVKDLTAKAVPAYLAARLAESHNSRLVHNTGTDRVDFTITLPASR